MSYRPARITQADVARAIRAAQQCGAGQVKVLPDGTITIDPQPGKMSVAREKEVAREEEFDL
jgi:hypothetical protein